jgi:hypothetical protein
MRGKGEEKRINTWRRERKREREKEKKWKEGGGTFCITNHLFPTPPEFENRSTEGENNGSQPFAHGPFLLFMRGIYRRETTVVKA